jgi:hypothetical protein
MARTEETTIRISSSWYYFTGVFILIQNLYLNKKQESLEENNAKRKIWQARIEQRPTKIRTGTGSCLVLCNISFWSICF